MTRKTILVEFLVPRAASELVTKALVPRYARRRLARRPVRRPEYEAERDPIIGASIEPASRISQVPFSGLAIWEDAVMENAPLVGSGASASLLLGRKLDSIPFSIYHVQIILVLGVVGFVEGYDLALSGSRRRARYGT